MDMIGFVSLMKAMLLAAVVATLLGWLIARTRV